MSKVNNMLVSTTCALVFATLGISVASPAMATTCNPITGWNNGYAYSWLFPMSAQEYNKGHYNGPVGDYDGSYGGGYYPHDVFFEARICKEIFGIIDACVYNEQLIGTVPAGGQKVAPYGWNNWSSYCGTTQ